MVRGHEPTNGRSGLGTLVRDVCRTALFLHTLSDSHQGSISHHATARAWDKPSRSLARLLIPFLTHSLTHSLVHASENGGRMGRGIILASPALLSPRGRL